MEEPLEEEGQGKQRANVFGWVLMNMRRIMKDAAEEAHPFHIRTYVRKYACTSPSITTLEYHVVDVGAKRVSRPTVHECT
jgi:hypothetical protein